jgi:DNA polymerase III delta prime subunit
MQHTIWNEKYRTINLGEFICDESLREDITHYIDKNDIPHLLLAGTAGVGKTTLAKLLCENLNCDKLYINASDENGVDIIREKVKNFASSASFYPLKIIILDEGDFLTKEAQAALRNVIETFSKTTRFIITCNYLEKIIEPLQSRCTVIKLSPPSKVSVAEKLADILNKEGVKYQSEDIVKIVQVSYPDIRRAIAIAQRHSLNNELKLGNDNLTSNYTKQILQKINNINKTDPTITWKEIRQIVADNDVKEFADLYRALYENYLNEPNVVEVIAKYLYQQNFVPDKEICFMACISNIIEKRKKLIYG